MKLGAFFDSDFGLLRCPAERGEDRYVGTEPKPIVTPVPCRDHPPIKVENALQLGTVE
jgi:hypothetical protein